MTDVIAFDTESYVIQPGLLAPPLVCVSFASKETTYLRSAAPGAADVRLSLVTGRTLVGHNVAYDLAVLCAYQPDLLPLVFKAYAEGRIKDTKIREELGDVANGRSQEGGAVMVFDKVNGAYKKADYSLAGLEQKYLGRDRSEEKKNPAAWRLRYGELDGVDIDQWPEEAVRYAKEDAEGTLAVYLAQEKANHGKPFPTEDDQARAAWALHLMSCHGMRTDLATVDALEVRLLAAKKANDRRLHQARFFKPRRATKDEVAAGNVDYWEPVPPEKQEKHQAALARHQMNLARFERREGLQLDVPPAPPEPPEPRPVRFAKDMERISGYVTRVYQRRLKKDPPKTESGRISTDRDTLSQSGSRLLQALADGGGVDKILQTYLPALRQGTEVPINARFHVLVNSGRTSCSGPNLQNLPSGKRIGGVRECFVPRPGFVFVSIDYSTLELRALADRCVLLFGKSRMAEAIAAGKDLHLVMAGQILRIPYAEAVARYKAKDPALKRARDLAKVANFGMGGGLGAASLVEYARASFGVILTEAEARKLKQDWLNAWPETALFFSYVSDQTGLGNARATDPVTGYVRGGLSYTALANHMFQHPSAMGGKAALFQLAWESYVDLGTPLYGSRGVAWVHDEWVAEIPTERLHAAAARASKVMNEKMATVIKNVPITSEPAAMLRWIKGAEPKYDQNNELVVYEEEAA